MAKTKNRPKKEKKKTNGKQTRRFDVVKEWRGGVEYYIYTGRIK